MRIRSLLLGIALILSACAQAQDKGFVTTSRFTMNEEPASEGNFAFTIREGETVVQDFGISHTKDMHLIVVRKDLEHFQHLHPVKDDTGMWTIALKTPMGGTYWFYADFVDTGRQPQTLRLVKEMPGEGQGEGNVEPHLGDLVQDPDGYDAAEKVVDTYRVQVATLQSSDGISFHYTVLDVAGKQVTFEEYLGEKGHSILISPEGDFVHTHPFKEYEGYKESDRPVFFVSYPRDAFYRIFTQFKINGKVLAVDYDWNVPQNPSRSADADEEQEEGSEADGHDHGGDMGDNGAPVRLDVLEE